MKRIIGIFRHPNVLEQAQIIEDFNYRGTWDEVCRRYGYTTEPDELGGGHVYEWPCYGTCGGPYAYLEYTYSLNARGADYIIFKFPEHSASHVADAKRALRDNYDVTSITVIRVQRREEQDE